MSPTHFHTTPLPFLLVHVAKEEDFHSFHNMSIIASNAFVFVFVCGNDDKLLGSENHRIMIRVHIHICV